MGGEASTTTADDERLVHRLEAFSDIVIGFCIAEAAFSLAVPHNAHQFAHLAAGIVPFGITFVVVVLVWWMHNRLFAKFYVASPVMLFANFAMLGLLALAVYFLQAFIAMSSVSSELALASSRWWFASFGGVYLLLMVMYAIGMRAKWGTLDDADRSFGARTVVRVGVGGAFFLFLGWQLENLRGSEITIAMAIFIVIAVLTRFVIPLILGKMGPAAPTLEHRAAEIVQHGDEIG